MVTTSQTNVCGGLSPVPAQSKHSAGVTPHLAETRGVGPVPRLPKPFGVALERFLDLSEPQCVPLEGVLSGLVHEALWLAE